MTDISMELVGNIFGGDVAGKFVAEVIGERGAAGIMETVTQQLGLGLMLSTLLITIPPMAGMWFNGVMGNFSPYAVIGGGNNNNRQEIPPHLDGGASRQMLVSNTNQISEQISTIPGHNSQNLTTPSTPGGVDYSKSTDSIKPKKPK